MVGTLRYKVKQALELNSSFSRPEVLKFAVQLNFNEEY